MTHVRSINTEEIFKYCDGYVFITDIFVYNIYPGPLVIKTNQLQHQLQISKYTNQVRTLSGSEKPVLLSTHQR